jgi:hypothetical protein
MDIKIMTRKVFLSSFVVGLLLLFMLRIQYFGNTYTTGSKQKKLGNSHTNSTQMKLFCDSECERLKQYFKDHVDRPRAAIYVLA